MIEYINFLLLCILITIIVFLYNKYLKYFHIINMVDSTIDDLLKKNNDIDVNNNNNNDIKDRLLQIVLTGESKKYLDKNYTEEQIEKFNDEKLIKLNEIYEKRLSKQMVKSLGKSVINIYSKMTCSLLKINNSDNLSDNIEDDPFLNNALQRFSCDLYYKYGAYIAPLSVFLITARHYYDEHKFNPDDSDLEDSDVEDK